MSIAISPLSQFNTKNTIEPSEQSTNNKKNNNAGLYSAIIGANVLVGGLHGVAKTYYKCNLHSPKLAKQAQGFKKVLDPADSWVFKQIDKLPQGHKLTSFLTKSNFNYKHLFGNFHYDLPLVLKGAGFMGIIGLATCGIIAGVSKLFQNNKC